MFGVLLQAGQELRERPCSYGEGSPSRNRRKASTNFVQCGSSITNYLQIHDEIDRLEFERKVKEKQSNSWCQIWIAQVISGQAEADAVTQSTTYIANGFLKTGSTMKRRYWDRTE